MSKYLKYISMNSIELKQNFNEVLKKKDDTANKFSRNPDDIRIIAVSKTHPFETIVSALKAGINVFGENYVQELVDKQSESEGLSTKPVWHFIGHLQSNKVKYIAQFISMIHSVDSLKLAAEISKQAAKYDRNIDILIQVNTSGEESKSGCEPNEAVEIAKGILELPNITLKGVMTIGTFSDVESIIRSEFRLLRKCLNDINSALDLNLSELSMGMSHDFDIAIEEGSTMVRVGTAIFGTRDYR